jgi:hypothetical protein
MCGFLAESLSFSTSAKVEPIRLRLSRLAKS